MGDDSEAQEGNCSEKGEEGLLFAGNDDDERLSSSA